MKPVKTRACNLLIEGGNIADSLPAYVEKHVEPNGRATMLITSFWKPSDAELKILADGGAVSLTIFGAPIPPVQIGVSPDSKESGDKIMNTFWTKKPGGN